MNLENICRTVINLARNTGQYIKSESTNFQSSDIEKKGKNDFVTHVDKGAEKK